jgi:hypothetical protein
MRSARSYLGTAVALAAVAATVSACANILGLQDRIAETDGGQPPDATAGPDGSTGGPDATNPFDAAPGPDGTAGPDSAGVPDTGVDSPIIITGTCPQPTCTMATALNHPYQMAIDGNRVYWTEYGTAQGSADGKVRACPLGGCPDAGPIDYVTLQSNPRGIAVDAQNVYWGTPGGVLWCPVTGCPAGSTGELLAAANTPFGITTAGGYVYWVEQGDDNINFNATVHRMPGPGQTNNVLYDGGTGVLFEPQGIAVDSQFIYVTDYFGTVYRIAVAGGEPAQIWPGSSSGVWPIVQDTNSAYFGNLGSIGRIPKATPNNGSAIYTQVSDPDNLFVDTSTGFIYWSDWGNPNATTNTGTIGKLPPDGGAAVVLKVSQATTEAVGVSGPYVYWMSNGTLDSTNNSGLANSGALYRAPK